MSVLGRPESWVLGNFPFSRYPEVDFEERMGLLSRWEGGIFGSFPFRREEGIVLGNLRSQHQKEWNAEDKLALVTCTAKGPLPDVSEEQPSVCNSAYSAYSKSLISEQNTTLAILHRKVLDDDATAEGIQSRCSKNDIVVTQGPASDLPRGMPIYTVQITNMCATWCAIANIHLNCGWFSSARLINPKIFKPLAYKDCLVNDGQPLAGGHTLSFIYATTFKFPLSVSSITCS